MPWPNGKTRTISWRDKISAGQRNHWAKASDEERDARSEAVKRGNQDKEIIGDGGRSEPRVCRYGCGMIARPAPLGKHEQRCFMTYNQLLIVGAVLGTIRQNDECLEWHCQNGATRPVNGKRPTIRGKRITHWVLEMTVGPAITPRLETCHTCDNGLCIKAEHLWWGTHHENMIDMAVKGRGSNQHNKHA